MQKFLLSTIGIFAFLFIGAGVYLSVIDSYKQVDAQGKALGAATSVRPTSLPEPTEVLPTEPPLNQSAVLAEAEGLQNPTLERKTLTIFKSKDLQKIWGTLYGSESAAPPQPVIDFTKNAVIIVLAGKQPSGQYKVTYTGIEETEDYTMVQFDETVPGDDCPATESMTSPFIAVQVPNTGKTFKTVFNTKQSVCN